MHTHNTHPHTSAGPGDEVAEDTSDDTAHESTEHKELDDNEGADAFETVESARETRRNNSGERQDEELISLDPPD